MFKVIFDFLTEPLGLPISWYWEYLLLAIIGFIAYNVSFSIVGDMYRLDLISGRTSGSFFHWLIRLIIFVFMWAGTYLLIWLGKLVIENWQMALIVFGISVFIFIVIFVIVKIVRIKVNRVDN